MSKCLATLSFAVLLAASGCVVVPYGGYRHAYSGRHYDESRGYGYNSGRHGRAYGGAYRAPDPY